MSDLSSSRYSSHRGSGQQRSPARSPASRTSLTSASSFPMAPIATWPRATTTAPVSVAMSSTAAGLKRRTNDSASHRIRRPSASVLMISIVLPKWLFTTSPGFTAVPDGRFSVAGIRPTTLTLGLSRPRTSNVPRTAVAPDLSNFMSSMFSAGLIEIPPESNVTPLPIKAIGAPVPPLYSRTMKRGSSALPCATARSAPIPSFLICARSRIVTPNLCCSASLRACSARYVGVQRFPGRNRVADAPTRLGLVLVARIHDQLDRFEIGLGILGLFLELGELPAALGRTLDRHLRQLRGPEAATRLFGDRKGEGLRPEAANASRGDRGGAADRSASDLAALPHADEEHALGLASAVHEERFVLLALVVSRRERALETRVF